MRSLLLASLLLTSPGWAEDDDTSGLVEISDDGVVEVTNEGVVEGRRLGHVSLNGGFLGRDDEIAPLPTRNWCGYSKIFIRNVRGRIKNENGTVDAEVHAGVEKIIVSWRRDELDGRRQIRFAHGATALAPNDSTTPINILDGQPVCITRVRVEGRPVDAAGDNLGDDATVRLEVRGIN